MVKQVEQNNQQLFQCEDCKLLYKEKEWAEKCQAWCVEHKSCNLEITKQAVNKQEIYG